MRRRVVGSLAAGCCAAGLLAGCARGDGPASTTATTPTTAVTTVTTVTTATTATTATAASVRPGATAAEARYLAAAHRAYPQRDDQALLTFGRDICERVAAHSAHDEVGQLAGELGNQSLAQEVVESATGAYCPVSSTTARSTPTS